MTRFILLISPHRLLLEIRINGKPGSLFSGDIQSYIYLDSDINFKTFVLLAVYGGSIKNMVEH